MSLADRRPGLLAAVTAVAGAVLIYVAMQRRRAAIIAQLMQESALPEPEAQQQSSSAERQWSGSAQMALTDEAMNGSSNVAPLASTQSSSLSATAAASSTAAPSVPVPAPSPAGAFSTRIVPLLDELKTTFAGSETRRVLVLELFEILENATTLKPKEQRKVARAFADSDGPEICYEIESCMKGDWVKDAKNGTMSALSKISRLPGPIGQVCSARA